MGFTALGLGKEETISKKGIGFLFFSGLQIYNLTLLLK